MASVDGLRSLHVSSDEMYDICGPCKTDGVTKEARHYCQNCRDYICDECKNYHRKLADTRKHVILAGNKISAFASKSSGLQIPCGCNFRQEVQHYCDDQQEVICNSCKTFKHHKCKTFSIQEISSDYKTSTFDLVLSKINSLSERYNQLKQLNIGNSSELKRLKEVCKIEIKTFRKDLESFVNNLEKDMLEELDKYEREELSRIDEHIPTLTTALTLLYADYTLLKDAEKNGRKEIMFAADVQVTSRLQGYESRLADLEKDVIKPSLLFERNKQLIDLQLDVKSLGFLKTKHGLCSHKDQILSSNGGRGNKKVFLDKAIQCQKQVNVRSADDMNIPCIFGCTMMPNGYVVLCDFNDTKLKLLDCSGVLIETLTLLCCTWDVSVVDSDNVIVTLPDNMQLQYVQVFPHMRAGRTIQLDKKCWGVAVSGNDIYVSCHNNPGDGEVMVLDPNGNFKTCLGVSKDGSFMFRLPSHVTVNKSGEKVIVSDLATHIITCMTADGRIIYKYRDNEIKRPSGLYCDSEDNILVCAFGSHKIQVITADGKKYATLMSSSDGLQYPRSIAYRESDDTLVIGCENRDCVLLFQLTEDT